MGAFLSLLVMLLFPSYAASCADGGLQKPETDYILVEKSKRLMTLYHKGKVIKQYTIALGFEPIGPKREEGDGKTPEGKYYIESKNKKSAYHLSLKVSYPSREDIQRAKKRGVKPGGDIMIHGLQKGLGWIGSRHALQDWTLGCIAVTNEEIEEIFASTETGVAIEIKP